MKYRRLWFVLVSALMAATQQNTGEAAAAVPKADQDQPARVQASVSGEEAVVTFFDQADYFNVLETAGALWSRLEAMPDRVLYCVAESYIRTGKIKEAKTGFEILVGRKPQNNNALSGLAYTLLYTGELDKGLALYKKVLLANHGLLTVAAEDAVALLAQGNVSGGKALFRMVIEISPDKKQYVQMYESSLRAYGLTDSIKKPQSKEQTFAVRPDTSGNNANKQLQTQAVELARNGQYQEAQKILTGLMSENPQDKSLVHDYIAALGWSGQNERAVALYEKQTASDMPYYVLKSVSDAYLRLNKEDKALLALQPATDRGERDALMRAGEINLFRGDIAAANAYYDRLLAKNPNDYEVYLTRGTQSIKAKDYRQATRDLERARRLVPDGPDKAIRLSQVEHDLATAYIHAGQDAKAADILVKYTKTEPVDSLVAGDYILALAGSGRHELAVKESERLWSAYSEAPVVGLRALAECYIKLGKQDKAITVYRHIAERQSSDDASWRTLAFQLMLSGRTAEGLLEYDRLLKKAANADNAVADAGTLLTTDKYIAGKMLFELVLKKYPDQAYRQKYAEALAGKNHNRAAYQQYQTLSGDSEGELAGLSGMVRSALAVGDYKKFREAFDTIALKYGRSKAVAAVAASYEERQPGSVATTFDALSDAQDIKSGAPSAAAFDAYAASQDKYSADDASRYVAIVKPSTKKTDPDAVAGPGYIDQETHQGLINDLMHIGKRKNHTDEIKIDGEVRYHYAANRGSGENGKNSSGFRTYIGADAKLNKDWHAYAMLENQMEIMNYSNLTKLSYLYVAGKVGTSTVRVGSFGYLMADGNIYDSRFSGFRVDTGEQVTYTLSAGKTDDTKSTNIVSVRYNDFDYNLEASVYNNTLPDSSSKTIKTISGSISLNDISLGAMYLKSNVKDANGCDSGYVYSVKYGDLREYRQGTYSIMGKYYNQAQGTYIAHGMNGRGAVLMQGFKGYGIGAYYTLAKHLVAGLEYYSLKDKVTGEKGKTTWLQVTHYF